MAILPAMTRAPYAELLMCAVQATCQTGDTLGRHRPAIRLLHAAENGRTGIRDRDRP